MRDNWKALALWCFRYSCILQCWHLLTGNSRCSYHSTFDPAPSECSWESSRTQAKYLSSCTQMGDPEVLSLGCDIHLESDSVNGKLSFLFVFSHTGLFFSACLETSSIANHNGRGWAKLKRETEASFQPLAWVQEPGDLVHPPLPSYAY